MASDADKGSTSWGISPIAFDGAPTRLKTVLFLVVCVAWLLPGLVGHDPWKTDEAMAFGAIYEMLKSGDWSRFRIAGEPLLTEPPLFLWTAAALAKLLGGMLAMHDAARLAAGVYMAATLALVSGTAWELMGERAVRMSVLLLIGCLGLLIRAHEMTGDLAGLTGIALGLYGLALAARRPWLGGALAGLGAGIGFLGNGLMPPLMLGALALVLPMAWPAWRSRRHAVTAAIALACAAPFALAWPTGLPMASDSAQGALFTAPYFLKLLTWYAWPAWPLATWTLWRARRTLAARTELHLPLAAFAVFFVVLAICGDSRDLTAMPLLLPLAILGVAELESLPRGAASALDWFGVMTFFLLAALLWIGWGAALTGKPEFAAAFLQKEVPGFRYQFSFLAFALASLLTLVWVVVVARSLRSTRRALVNWAAGITMVWMLVMTLGVPLVDQARSYRVLSARLVDALPPGFQCIAPPRRGRRTAGAARLLRERADDQVGAPGVRALRRFARAGPAPARPRPRPRLDRALARLAPGRPQRDVHPLQAGLEPRVEQLDPVAHRRRGSGLQVREAADVRGGDERGLARFERRDLVAQELA
jgi:4-amino-4-deoxy-L-arabinose transferase-like glycosyltransferase